MDAITGKGGVTVSVTQPHVASYPMHSHPEWEFLYYRRGSGRLKTERGEIPFFPGTFLFVPPYLMHGSYSEEEFEDVCISCEGFRPAHGGMDVLCGRDEKGTVGHLADVVCEVYFACEDGARALVRDLSVSLFLLAEMSLSDRKDSRPARPVKDAIDAGYAYPGFDLAEVIRRSGYAPNYVRDSFRRDYGVSPLQYLTSRRIGYACRLLSHFGDALPISEVACRSGFSDPLYFSRLFRQRMGVSPREFRKSRRSVHD